MQEEVTKKKQCTLPCAVYKVPGQVAIVLVCLIAGPSHKMNNIADTSLAHKKRGNFIRFHRNLNSLLHK